MRCCAQNNDVAAARQAAATRDTQQICSGRRLATLCGSPKKNHCYASLPIGDRMQLAGE